MARVLLLLVIAFFIYLLFRGFLRSQAKRDAPPPVRSAKGEDMVSCARCGVNMPRSDARDDAGKLVCRDNAQCR